MEVVSLVFLILPSEIISKKLLEKPEFIPFQYLMIRCFYQNKELTIFAFLIPNHLLALIFLALKEL